MAKTDIIRQLSEHFRQQNIRNMVVLTDENVEKYNSDYFADLSGGVSIDKIVLPAGEKSKSIETIIQIWQYLADKQYDRNTFLLNFGGGVVCDLGGFVASTYKRGIRFANVPTTLLAMIDAAVGGKTGVDMQHLKNVIGTFYFPEIQLPADISLLKTLPQDELISGFGELVKYALIGSAELFHELCQSDTFPLIKPEFVDFCVKFKQQVVQKDPEDQNYRHILNFGHTFGHAIESYCAEMGNPIAHGLAVAQGLYYESLLSAELGYLPQEEWQQIADFLTKHFHIMSLTSDVLKHLTKYMLNDKKNRNDLINFTLLEHIGSAILDFPIASDTLADAIRSYNNSITF
jgi:3-dehydroquinate synthase